MYKKKKLFSFLFSFTGIKVSSCPRVRTLDWRLFCCPLCSTLSFLFLFFWLLDFTKVLWFGRKVEGLRCALYCLLQICTTGPFSLSTFRHQSRSVKASVFTECSIGIIKCQFAFANCFCSFLPCLESVLQCSELSLQFAPNISVNVNAVCPSSLALWKWMKWVLKWVSRSRHRWKKCTTRSGVPRKEEVSSHRFSIICRLCPFFSVQWRKKAVRASGKLALASGWW